MRVISNSSIQLLTNKQNQQLFVEIQTKSSGFNTRINCNVIKWIDENFAAIIERVNLQTQRRIIWIWSGLIPKKFSGLMTFNSFSGASRLRMCSTRIQHESLTGQKAVVVFLRSNFKRSNVEKCRFVLVCVCVFVALPLIVRQTINQSIYLPLIDSAAARWHLNLFKLI